MNPKEFIIGYLNQIHDRIKKIGFKYAYDEEIDYHVVEVEPASMYDKNKEYIEMEMRFVEDFHNNYPNRNIVVSTNREIHDMNNTLYAILPENVVSFSIGDVNTDYKYNQDRIFNLGNNSFEINLAA